MRLHFAALWNAGRHFLQHIAMYAAVKCNNMLMTEEAVVLQRTALTAAATDALSIDWRCE